METYKSSYDCNVIVPQLTKILDYIDDNSNLFAKNVNIEIISYLSLCLEKSNNYSLLPYLYVLDKYRNDTQKCVELMTEVYYKNVSFKIMNKLNISDYTHHV